MIEGGGGDGYARREPDRCPDYMPFWWWHTIQWSPGTLLLLDDEDDEDEARR